MSFNHSIYHNDFLCPEGWDKFKLSEFVDMNPRVNLKKGESYSFVEMKDLNPSNKIVQPSGFKEYKNGTKFQNNDILFARITPCLENGKICMVKGLRNNLGFGSTEFIVLRGKTGVSENEYVYYLSRSSEVREGAIQVMTGTSGRQRVERSGFENIEILAPKSLKEQSRISEILTSLDTKIELNLQMNRTLESIAQTIFKEWFIDFRFPGFNGDMVEGLPRGWSLFDLGDVSTLIAGGDKPESVTDLPDEKNTVPIYSNGITNDGLYGYTDRSRINEESVTVSARGTIGFVCLRNQPYVPIVRLIAVVPNIKYITSKFLYLWLKNQKITGTGTTQQQLTVPDFKRSKILIPRFEIMTEFTILMDSIFDKIDSNVTQNKMLIKIRDNLLPKLISGKIKV